VLQGGQQTRNRQIFEDKEFMARSCLKTFELSSSVFGCGRRINSGKYPIIFVMSVGPSTRISATSTGRLFVKFDIGNFY
jgi:hypothetical protein